MYKNFLYLLFVLLSFILISCRYKNYYSYDNYQTEQWRKHQKFLLGIVNYEIRGVIICFLHEKKMRLQFFLQKINSEYLRLIFSDPIGFNNIEMNILKNGKFFIHENIRNSFYFYNFEKLLEKLENDGVLLKNIQSWMIGLPGSSINFNLNKNGFLNKIGYQYNNITFTILYKNYYNDIVPSLPKFIEVHYNKDVYFYIKIYKWII